MSDSGTEGSPPTPERKARTDRPNWAEVEAFYLSCALSVELVAEHFGVSPRTAANHAKKGQWPFKRRRLWRAAITEGTKRFESSLVLRVAQLMTLEADDSVGQLQELQGRRLKEGSRWTMIEHAAYARACQIQSERARRVLRIKDDDTGGGIPPVVKFAWVPKDARPQQIEPPTTGEVLTLDEAGKKVDDQ